MQFVASKLIIEILGLNKAEINGIKRWSSNERNIYHNYSVEPSRFRRWRSQRISLIMYILAMNRQVFFARVLLISLIVGRVYLISGYFNSLRELFSDSNTAGFKLCKPMVFYAENRTISFYVIQQ